MFSTGNIIIFILFILLVLIIVFICNAIHGGLDNSVKAPLLQSYIGGFPNKNAISMQAQRAEMSYTISGEKNGLDYSVLREILSQNAFKERPINEAVHLSIGGVGGVREHEFDPLFYKQRSAIKNFLDKHTNLINKMELYSTIKKYIPLGVQFIPNTFNMKIFEQSNIYKNAIFPHPIIMKLWYSSFQRGVQVAETKEQYLKIKKEFKMNNINAILSDYIINTMVNLEGKKFHLRVYFLLSSISGIIRCSAHKEYKISTAKEKYVAGDWLNTDIHLSGGHNTYNKYIWPDDADWTGVDKPTVMKNLESCITVACLALTMVHARPFEETNAGYQLLGADILLTKDGNAYILEMNRSPYFTFLTKKEYWDSQSVKLFSRDLFTFILNNTTFPYLGIGRWPKSTAEFIDNGALSPFGNILIGENKCVLIPYSPHLPHTILSATKKEIKEVNKLNFFNSISFENIVNACNDIYLIGTNDTIIGFIGMELKNKYDYYLSIAIKKEYQNRGIATAMIAQLLEIYVARQFIGESGSIYIKKQNEFLSKIALKLHFILNNDGEYERKFKILTKVKHQYDHNELTYKIISNNEVHLYIDQFMKPSHSQFVHFLFNKSSYDELLKSKYSTGSHYSIEFINQGCELKSALIIKILYNVRIFKYWYKKQSTHNKLFEKIINSPNEIKNDQEYIIYNKETGKHKIQIGNQLQFDNNDTITSEHHMPFLLNEVLMALRCYLIIYMSGNGVIKFFCLDKKIVVTDQNKYVNNVVENDSARYFKTDKIYHWPNDFKTGELSQIATDETILSNFINDFFEALTHYDIKPYSESNAGFMLATIDVKFIKQNNNWIPILQKTLNFTNMEKNNIIDDLFVKHYYTWVRDCVIYPHFGLSAKYIKPALTYVNNKEINNTIIEKLLLHRTNSNVDIIYFGKKIGHIKLDLTNTSELLVKLSHIEIDQSHRKQGIAMHSIFMLMEIIATYYSPMQMSLSFEDRTIMHSIAYKLQFYKMDYNTQQTKYFIRKCRI